MRWDERVYHFFSDFGLGLVGVVCVTMAYVAHGPLDERGVAVVTLALVGFGLAFGGFLTGWARRSDRNAVLRQQRPYIVRRGRGVT